MLTQSHLMKLKFRNVKTQPRVIVQRIIINPKYFHEKKKKAQRIRKEIHGNVK